MDDYYINTIYDMQNEKDCLNYYNEFEHIQRFEKLFKKSDDALLVFVILDKNVYLFEIDYYKFYCWFIYLIKYLTSLSSNC